MFNPRWFLGLAPLAVVLLGAAHVSADEPGREVDEARLEALAQQLQALHAEALTLRAEADAQERYWIGISAEEQDGGKGLKVLEVIDGSPAAKAGLKVGDVIVSVSREPVGSIEKLSKTIAESKGERLSFHIRRGDKTQGIAVQPEKHRSEGVFEFKIGGPGEREEHHARGKDDDDDDDHKGPKGGPRFEFSIPGIQVHPAPSHSAHPANPGARAGSGGIVRGPGGFGGGMGGMLPGMPAQMAQLAQMNLGQLPDDMEVTISKKGNKPAVITATQGVKMWQTDETEMEMLPPPARAYAARLLGHATASIRTTQPMMGGAGMSGAMMPPQIHWQQAQPAQRLPAQSEERGRNPHSNGPNIKQLPGGGIQIEIREEDEHSPSDRKPEGRRER